MAMDPNEIVRRIAARYPEALVDVAGEDCSFEVYVISAEFEGMMTMQRQQPILALFADELATGKLHALSLKTKTPGEVSAQPGLVQIG